MLLIIIYQLVTAITVEKIATPICQIAQMLVGRILFLDCQIIRAFTQLISQVRIIEPVSN